MADHEATQTVHPWRATVRTVVQSGVALAASAPLIAAAITGDSVEAAGGAVATFVAVSAIITRLMAVPVVNDLLTRLGMGAEPKQ